MNPHWLFRATASVVIALFVVGCGGGSSSSEPVPDPDPIPEPVPPPDPDPGAGSASHCFNPTLFASGTTYTLNERTTDGGDVYDSIVTITVDGPATFNGQAVTRLFGSLVGGPDGSGDFELFVSVDGVRVSNHGAQVIITAPPEAASTSTVVNEPPELDRFDLAPGQSYVQTYRQTISVQTAGGSWEIGQTIESLRTYVGRESMRVPAGGFATCRFDEVETITTDSYSATVDGVPVAVPGRVDVASFSEWIGVNIGLPIRIMDADGEVTELVSATLNGQAVVGY